MIWGTPGKTVILDTDITPDGEDDFAEYSTVQTQRENITEKQNKKYMHFDSRLYKPHNHHKDMEPIYSDMDIYKADSPTWLKLHNLSLSKGANGEESDRQKDLSRTRADSSISIFPFEYLQKNYDIPKESYEQLKRHIIPANQFPERQKWKAIGKGAFGDVYLVNWQQSKVAIKVTKNSKHNPRNIRNSFIESEMMEKCSNHPNVCRFIGVVFDEVNRSLWLATQYYEHGSLKQY
eukprot:UN32249